MVAYAKNHEYLYLNEKAEYLKDHDKKKHLNNIWKGDDEFIEKSRNSKDDPIVGKIASKFIDTKERLEKSGMDSKIFSGFWIKQEDDNVSEKNSDPAF